jgi:hypothetical protein
MKTLLGAGIRVHPRNGTAQRIAQPRSNWLQSCSYVLWENNPAIISRFSAEIPKFVTKGQITVFGARQKNAPSFPRMIAC